MTGPASVHTEEPAAGARSASGARSRAPARRARAGRAVPQTPCSPIGIRCVRAEPFRALAAPPVGCHPGVARVVARAEGEVLDAFGARLDRAHRVPAEP